MSQPPETKSFAVQVIVQGSKHFRTTGVRFAGRDEAKRYADTFRRIWTLVQWWRVIPSSFPVNVAADEDGALTRKGEGERCPYRRALESLRLTEEGSPV